jgi:hypothetical protein
MEMKDSLSAKHVVLNGFSGLGISIHLLLAGKLEK